MVYESLVHVDDSLRKSGIYLTHKFPASSPSAEGKKAVQRCETSR
jgi:hypothetical protein